MANVALRQRQRPGGEDEAIKQGVGGREVAGADAADLVGGCGGAGEDGGVRVNEEQLIGGEPQRERDERLCLRFPSAMRNPSSCAQP